MTEIVSIQDGLEVDQALVLRVRAALGRSAMVAVPTDTVYGLAVDPLAEGGVAKVFRAKERPVGLQLPLLCANEIQAASLALAWEGAAPLLASKFWPGPLTIVVLRSPSFTAQLGGPQSTLGLRVPGHPFVQALCAGGAIATTSANRHGQAPARSAEEVTEALCEDLDLVIDGGTCPGIASTVVDCSSEAVVLLREGAIPRTEIEEALGNEVARG